MWPSFKADCQYCWTSLKMVAVEHDWGSAMKALLAVDRGLKEVIGGGLVFVVCNAAYFYLVFPLAGIAWTVAVYLALLCTFLWTAVHAARVHHEIKAIDYSDTLRRNQEIQSDNDAQKRENNALRAALGAMRRDIANLKHKPEIDVKIIEVFIHAETSLCFVHFSLHNTALAGCNLPPDIQAYSLSLKLKGNDTVHDKHRLANVLDRHYLSVFEDDFEYSEAGYQYETTREVDKESLPTTRDVLSRGKLLDRWIGFQLRNLPAWPYVEEPRGQHEEIHVDHETGYVETEWVTDYDRTLLTDNVEVITLTVVDPFDCQHSGSKSAPFSIYGRAVVRRK